VIEGFERVAEKNFFSGGDGKRSPPFRVFLREGRAGRHLEHMTVEEAVEPVAGHGPDSYQAATVSQKAADFAYVERGNPNLRDEAGGGQFGELDGIVLVGFDSGFVDPGELTGVGDLDFSDQADDAIVEIPGIGGGFDGEDVCGQEMILCPVRLFFEGYFPGFEDDLLK
jgi:hypothetical protein